MSSFAVGICSVLYLYTSFELLVKGQVGLSLTFFSYALANVGLIFAMMSKV